MSLLIPVALLIAVLMLRTLPPAYRHYRARTQLRGDWWPRFERDLREYMSQTWRSARDAERHL